MREADLRKLGCLSAVGAIADFLPLSQLLTVLGGVPDVWQYFLQRQNRRNEATAITTVKSSPGGNGGTI